MRVKARSNVTSQLGLCFRTNEYFPLGMRIDRQQHTKHRIYIDMGIHCVLTTCWRTCDSLFMNSTSICLSLWGAMKYTHTSTRGSCKHQSLHQTQSASCRTPTTVVVAEGSSGWAALSVITLTVSGVPQGYHWGFPPDQAPLHTQQDRRAAYDSQLLPGLH